MITVQRTAVAIARVRAEENDRPEHERLFSDPIAHLFAVGDDESDAGIARFYELPFFREQVRLRTRFFDDEVRDALAQGIRQVILLGAGFDGRAHRLVEIDETRTLVFEVDLDEQLSYKKHVLQSAGASSPPHVRYVACDFSARGFGSTLRPSLISQGFATEARTLIVWEGVIGYLGDAEVNACLSFLESLAAEGSRLTFNYPRWRISPEELPRRLAAAGFGLSYEIGCDRLWHRYLEGPPPQGGDVFRVALAERNAGP
jgi:methyltransferase (TIGR00027 family)